MILIELEEAEFLRSNRVGMDPGAEAVHVMGVADTELISHPQPGGGVWEEGYLGFERNPGGVGGGGGDRDDDDDLLCLKERFPWFSLVPAGSHWFYHLRPCGIKDLDLNTKAEDCRSSWCTDGNRNNSGREWAAMYGLSRRAGDHMKSTQAVSNFN